MARAHKEIKRSKLRKNRLKDIKRSKANYEVLAKFK